MKIGILASHEGTTLQAIIDACATGVIPGQVVAVISNNRDSGALQRARAAGIATHHLSSQTHTEPEALDAAICGTLTAYGVDIVVLAGYMKKLGSQDPYPLSGPGSEHASRAASKVRREGNVRPPRSSGRAGSRGGEEWRVSPSGQ